MLRIWGLPKARGPLHKKYLPQFMETAICGVKPEEPLGHVESQGLGKFDTDTQGVLPESAPDHSLLVLRGELHLPDLSTQSRELM